MKSVTGAIFILSAVIASQGSQPYVHDSAVIFLLIGLGYLIAGFWLDRNTAKSE